MIDRGVHIIKISPMTLVVVSAFGLCPEKDAWHKLIENDSLKEIVMNRNEHPVFGCRTLGIPTEDSGFGYELWIKVSSDFKPPVPSKLIGFAGGSYAVARCQTVCRDKDKKRAEWDLLRKWCRRNHFRTGQRQPLERYIEVDDRYENLVLDLYFPIEY